MSIQPGPGRPPATYQTPGGVTVTCAADSFDPAVLDDLTRRVEQVPGGVLSSGMEYPGRYSRWHVAYADPPVEITATGRTITARARGDRGAVLLPVIAAALGRAGEVTGSGREVSVTVEDPGGTFTEEQRSRRPSVFSALREVIADLAGPGSGHHRPLGQAFVVVGQPVDEPVAIAAEFFGRHRRPSARRSVGGQGVLPTASRSSMRSHR